MLLPRHQAIRSLGMWLIPLLLTACQTNTPRTDEDQPKLTVAISPDIPPYVLDSATDGLEVDIARAALADYQLEFIQLPYAQLQTAVADGKAKVSLGVQQDDQSDVYYSGNFVAFVNVAVTKKNANLTIDTIPQLADHQILTWQNAWQDLGPEFSEMYGPNGPQRAHYEEFADQAQQVEAFWAAEDAVCVIDHTIFEYMSEQADYDLADCTFHELFPGVTDFRAAFADETQRDQFNAALQELCSSGNYQALLDEYHLDLPITICDE